MEHVDFSGDINSHEDSADEHDFIKHERAKLIDEHEPKIKYEKTGMILIKIE